MRLSERLVGDGALARKSWSTCGRSGSRGSYPKQRHFSISRDRRSLNQGPQSRECADAPVQITLRDGENRRDKIAILRPGWQSQPRERGARDPIFRASCAVSKTLLRQPCRPARPSPIRSGRLCFPSSGARNSILGSRREPLRRLPKNLRTWLVGFVPKWSWQHSCLHRAAPAAPRKITCRAEGPHIS
jgi:hypothetical protein